MVLADAEDVEVTAVGNLDLVEKAVHPIGGRRWPAYRRIRTMAATLSDAALPMMRLRIKPTVDCNRDLSLNTVVGTLQPAMGERNIGKLNRKVPGHGPRRPPYCKARNAIERLSIRLLMESSPSMQPES